MCNCNAKEQKKSTKGQWWKKTKVLCLSLFLLVYGWNEACMCIIDTKQLPFMLHHCVKHHLFYSSHHWRFGGKQLIVCPAVPHVTRPPVGHLNLQDSPWPVKGQGEVGRKVQADQRAARGRQVTISAEAGTKGRHILLSTQLQCHPCRGWHWGVFNIYSYLTVPSVQRLALSGFNIYSYQHNCSAIRAEAGTGGVTYTSIYTNTVPSVQRLALRRF